MPKICSVDNCEYPVFGKGYCKRHQYMRKEVKKALKKTKINPISSKHKAELTIYSQLARQFKADNPYCQARFDVCTNLTQDVHHKAGRYKNLNKVETFLAVCRPCHEYIHAHGKEAREKGFLI